MEASTIMRKARAIRIGIALNSRDRGYAPDLADQYTSRQTRDDVAGALTGLGAEVVEIEADDALFERLSALAGSFDLVLNLAEGLPRCHSRHVTVPMALDHLGLEWTGSRVEGHLLAANKALARRILGDRVAQPEWWCLDDGEQPLPGSITFPVLVKPVREGNSVGIDQASVATSASELERALARLRARADGPVLVESFLDGMEYSIGLVGEVVLPAVSWDLSRMPDQPKVRGEDLKRADLTMPHARLVRDPAIARSLATQAVTSHTELGLRDYSRSDFRARRGLPTPYFLETNSMPFLRDHQSILSWAAGRAGVAYRDVIGSIVALALRRLPEDHLRRLDASEFEAAYDRLQDRADPTSTLHVRGREYRLLEPLPSPTGTLGTRSPRPALAATIG